MINKCNIKYDNDVNAIRLPKLSGILVSFVPQEALQYYYQMNKIECNAFYIYNHLNSLKLPKLDGILVILLLPIFLY